MSFLKQICQSNAAAKAPPPSPETPWWTPLAPERPTTAPLPAGLPPPAPCPVCSCPAFWIDPYGRVHCESCRTPRIEALVRRRLFVRSGIDTGDPNAPDYWEDFDPDCGEDVLVVRLAHCKGE